MNSGYEHVPLTVDASVRELVHALYPELSELGVRNYAALITRLGTPEFQALLEERRAQGKCLTQPRIAEGEPHVADCLVHDTPDTLSHHFAQSPDANTD